MKKKFFNLAVILATLMSSAVFSSCGDDDDEEEPKKETPTNNNDNKPTDDKGNEDKTPAESTTSFTAVKGDSYTISNAKLNINGASMKVDDVAGTTVTLNVSGSTVVVGSANADKSYAIVATNGGVAAASMADAKANPETVLFICKEGSVIASGTLANDATIKAGAGETTFTKQ